MVGNYTLETSNHFLFSGSQFMAVFLRVIFVTTLCLATTHVGAQHDPQRNATRHIVKGDYAKAEKELAKANAAESETKFVQMMLALEKDDLEQAEWLMREGVAAGLPVERLVAGPRSILKKLHAGVAYQELMKQHQPALLHGPMLGSVTDRAATVWLRTAKAADVSVRYREVGKKHLPGQTKVYRTRAAEDFTAAVRLNGLAPKTRYDYWIVVDGNESPVENAMLTTFPEENRAASFSVCFGGGAGFVPQWERMWDVIGGHQPHAMLMLGDNVYIDDPEHSETSHYCYYRRQSRPEWRRFTARTAMYSIYDDHDFGTNDCVPGAEIESPVWKRKVWRIFQQNWVNPAYGGGEAQPGCWYDFMIGDVHFIMLDGRYYRSRKPQPSMLGDVQKRWLLETLKRSSGTFKVIASPVPFTANIKPGSKDPWDGYADEREEIFQFLEKEKVDGVLLICADRHRTDLRVTKRSQGYDLFEFESSRLTNRHTHSVVKTPGLIWGYNNKCSFARMEFNTQLAVPEIRMEARSIDDELMHSYTLTLDQLKHR
ncbi:MAG: alkaline phosphatase [Blastopirellula sp.]|nr:alkaline phosphatase [Blastopirellula sp.]